MTILLRLKKARGQYYQLLHLRITLSVEAVDKRYHLFWTCHITNLLAFFEYLVPSGMKYLVPQLLTSQQAIFFLL